MSTSLASELPVVIGRDAFDAMLRFARVVFGLKDNLRYLEALEAEIPAAAQIPGGWPSVLMGFDFHLTDDGPKLIEINNNAGGLYIGDGRWLPQPAIDTMRGTLQQRLIAMFHDDWHTIAIMDEDVTGQFMYPEMQAYADLLREDGREVVVLSPDDLNLTGQGLCSQGRRIDAIYNRHTDFYLESEAVSHIRQAYEQRLVALNPHPRSYALIGDKTRMVDWWHPGLLETCLGPDEIALIRSITPETRQLRNMDRDMAWQQRKQWVFKPAARHGGKGVLLGKAMSRKRFEGLDVNETIVQRLVPAPEVMVESRSMKCDIRLYLHGDDLIALAGRVWNGQVTNFREPGSGWISIAIEE